MAEDTKGHTLDESLQQRHEDAMKYTKWVLEQMVGDGHSSRPLDPRSEEEEIKRLERIIKEINEEK